MQANIELRGLTEKDLPFVFATWLHAYKKESYFAKRIKRDVFFKEHHRLIELLLGKSQILVAHPIGEPDVILGYLVYTSGVVHFAFVKPEFRKLGIAKTMLNAAKFDTELQFTHWTFSMDDIIKTHPEMTYNPYAL